MKIKIIEFDIMSIVPDFLKKKKEEQKAEPKAYYPPNAATWAFGVGFDGEKNWGEIGPVKDYYLLHESIRLRGWEAKLTNEVASTILKKYVLWVIGSGLKLKAEPDGKLLKAEGIQLDTEKFNNDVEARFKVWAKSKNASYNRMDNLYTLSSKLFDNGITGGDCVWVLRFKDNNVSVQLIDGCHLQNVGNNTINPLNDGNIIVNGIEINSKGEQVAYHIVKKNFEVEVIQAYNSLGLKVAGLFYGNKLRLDNQRGISILTQSLETLAKLDRYKEAIVGTAEEQAKVTYQVVHGKTSTGDNPFQTSLVKLARNGYDANVSEAGLGSQFSPEGQQLAETIAKTTNKQAINNTQDSEIKPLQASSSQFYFKEFFGTNIDLVAAGIGIPPNVAMSLYNDSFSASRAATKDWEHTLNVKREDFVFQFLQNVYDFWLHIQILRNKVSAPGYLEAFMANDQDIINAYRNCRFTGTMFPHIDPLKEVNAVRAKLGDRGNNLPLITQEQAVEDLGGGEGSAVMRQFSEELKMAEEELGIETEEVMRQESPDSNPKKGDKKKDDNEDD